jgi:hypothetical protein
MYAVQTAPTVNICVGDIHSHGLTSVSTPHLGTLPILDDAAVPDDDAALVGAVLAVYDEDMYPLSYIPAGRVGNGTIAGYALIADHPEQLFVAQEDGDTTPIAAASLGLNANIISATLCAPNTTTGISTQEINSDTVANTTALQVQVLFAHPDDEVGSANCRFICKINENMYVDPAAGH